MDDPSGHITHLLHQLRAGDSHAESQLIPLVYAELRQLAARRMARESPGHTLQPTALVHEAYLRLTKKREVDWQDRQHFFAVAAREMRRVLVDMARMRDAVKRGGPDAFHVSIDDVPVVAEENFADMVVLNDALDRLGAVDARQRAIVDMRLFGGLTVEEIAQTLDISSRTVKREWSFARAWLIGQLAGHPREPRG
jgi:RNA polymerase sigma-70 factor, ECF subfamily